MGYPLQDSWASLVAQLVNSPPTMQETWVRPLSLGRSPGEGIGYQLQYSWVSLVAQMVKNPPATRETWVQSLDWEDSLEEGMTSHSNILAWRIPMNRRAWRATVHGATRSQTQLSN